MTDHYAVIGHPIGHSKSPLIHSLFARQFDMDMDYVAIDAEPGYFAETVSEFRESGGKGLNVTVPYKQEAFDLVNRREPRAEHAGAVNTIIVREDGELVGDNTDGVGFVRDLLVNHKTLLSNMKVLIVGAGGAVRGVLGPLLNERPAQVVIANRTVAKAEALAALFADLGNVAASGFDGLEGGQFDMVINGTAAGLEGEVPALPDNLFADHGLAYDLMYGDRPTAFMHWSLESGAETAVDGLGMLVEQAAESFYLWRGRKPRTQPVIEALRAK